MKYLITESKLEKVIFKYLDNQDFIQIDKDNSWCYIYHKLINEISSFFSLELTDSKDVIGRWVENTLQMRVNNTQRIIASSSNVVENTL